MELLDLLVTSETKKKLLALLWRDGVEASANQLAQLAGASYANVYDELERFVEAGLACKTVVGRANHYSKNPYFSEAGLLERLVGAPETDSQASLTELDASEVRALLLRLGAPLASEAEARLSLSVEEALVAGVLLSRSDSTVARVMPVCFAKKRAELDFERLVFLAQREKATQEVGFFLDLSGTLSGSRKLKEAAKRFSDKRVKKDRSFFLNASKGRYSQMLEEKNTPRIAKKWHFSMNMGLDSFASLYEKSMK